VRKNRAGTISLIPDLFSSSPTDLFVQNNSITRNLIICMKHFILIPRANWLFKAANIVYYAALVVLVTRHVQPITRPCYLFSLYIGGVHKYDNRKILQQELVLRISTRSDRIYIISQSQTMNKPAPPQCLQRGFPVNVDDDPFSVR